MRSLYTIRLIIST